MSILSPPSHIRLWAGRLLLVCWLQSSHWPHKVGTAPLAGGEMPLATWVGGEGPLSWVLSPPLASSAVWPCSGLGCAYGAGAAGAEGHPSSSSARVHGGPTGV